MSAAVEIGALQRHAPGRISNPFGEQPEGRGNEIGNTIVQSQAMASIQGAVAMAKRFPRDQAAAVNRIIDACTRIKVAEQAEYAFPRGSETVSGPSIRLAEVIAQNWGNIDFGVIELEQTPGRSQVMAYCWDLETNVRQQKVFVVEHFRQTKKGGYELTDPRDIYELTANQGSRRVRACILGVIPGDVIDAAITQCHVTLKNSMKAPEQEIRGMIEAFSEFGVAEDAIKKRLGKNLNAVTAAEVIRMRSIYASIRDGMSSPADWFDLGAGGVQAPTGGTKAADPAPAATGSGGPDAPAGDAPAAPRSRKKAAPPDADTKPGIEASDAGAKAGETTGATSESSKGGFGLE